MLCPPTFERTNWSRPALECSQKTLQKLAPREPNHTSPLLQVKSINTCLSLGFFLQGSSFPRTDDRTVCYSGLKGYRVCTTSESSPCLRRRVAASGHETRSRRSGGIFFASSLLIGSTARPRRAGTP